MGDRAHVHPRTPAACRAGWTPAHRPQEHRHGEVLDVVVHTGLVHGCRLRTVVTILPSRARVSSWARRRQCLGAARRPRWRFSAASGIDRASAQLTTWHLRDGREETAWSVQMLEFRCLSLTPCSHGRILWTSRRCHMTPPPHRIQCMRSAVPILAPRARSNATRRSSARCSSTAGARMTDPGLRNEIGSQRRSSSGPAFTESTGPSAVRDTRREPRRGPRCLVLAAIDRDHRRAR